MFSEDVRPNVPLVVAGMAAVLVQLTPGADRTDDVEITLYGTPIPTDFEVSTNHAITIIYGFKPFSMAALFGIDASALAKNPISCDDWNSKTAGSLKDRLMAASHPLQMINVLDEFFITQLAHHSQACEAIRIATDNIMINPDADMLSQLPDQLNMTRRTFQRMFKKYVGISATEYRRICQFQQSFQQVRSKQFDKLSDVAADNGFTDQSHFVRSFREFSSTTPGKYVEHGLKPK
ncbi:helix-turn-helix domain-containing protein [Chryseolinea sp. T2]|uniref:helix-turn-helix domain-containing protein n=1 Tax=Chryseolinea sp. T2 TaxID=3129255 RepID=UPI003076BD6F